MGGILGHSPKWNWHPHPTPPPLADMGLFWTWDFFELGTFLKWVDPPPKINLGLGTFLKRNDPLKNFRNKLNIKNIGAKSINMSEIMVYLAMFITTIDQICYCFIGPHEMKRSHYFSVLETIWAVCIHMDVRTL